jgi:O-antigen ligase
VSLWLFASHLWTIWGIALSNVFLGLTSLWCIFLWRTAKKEDLPWHRRQGPGTSFTKTRAPVLLAPLFFYVLCFVASALGSLDPKISLLELREILSLPTLVLTLLLVRGERQTRFLFNGLMAVIALLAFHGIVQNYLGGYGTLHRRVPGLFSHYQTFAGVLLLGALLLVARLSAGKGRHRLWYFAGLVVVVWAMLLTLTRGAWVAFILALGVCALVRARRHLGPILAGAGLALVLFFNFAPESWTSRMRSITDVRDPSNYDRLCMADAAFYMINERPLFGIGPEMVRHQYPIYRHPTAPRFTVPHLHNTFLQLAAEQGLLSLAAYLWLMLGSLTLAWHGYRKHLQDSPADLHLGVFLAIIGFNLAGLFEDNWRDTEVQRLILFLLAVPVCLEGEAAAQNATGGAVLPRDPEETS